MRYDIKMRKSSVNETDGKSKQDENIWLISNYADTGAEFYELEMKKEANLMQEFPVAGKIPRKVKSYLSHQFMQLFELPCL